MQLSVGESLCFLPLSCLPPLTPLSAADDRILIDTSSQTSILTVHSPFCVLPNASRTCAGSHWMEVPRPMRPRSHWRQSLSSWPPSESPGACKQSVRTLLRFVKYQWGIIKGRRLWVSGVRLDFFPIDFPMGAPTTPFLRFFFPNFKSALRVPQSECIVPNNWVGSG